MTTTIQEKRSTAREEVVDYMEQKRERRIAAYKKAIPILMEAQKALEEIRGSEASLSFSRDGFKPRDFLIMGGRIATARRFWSVVWDIRHWCEDSLDDLARDTSKDDDGGAFQP